MAKIRTNIASQITQHGIEISKEPRCRICQSPLRDFIDKLAVAGFGQTAIADEIMGKDPNLTTSRDGLRKSIDRHVREHLTIRGKAIRNILERRAKEEGILVEHMEGQIVSEMAFLDMAVRQGTEQLADPNTKMAYRDVLEAVRIKHEMERGQFSEQLEVLNRQLMAISQAVKDIVPDHMFPQLTQRAKELFDRDILELPRKQKKVEKVEIKELKE